MITGSTIAVFCERVQRRLQNDYPSATFTVTNNEIILFYYDAVAQVIAKASNDAYAIEGVHAIPEGFITTFKYNASSLTLNADTGEYEATLPHAPLSVPNSIKSPRFIGTGKTSFPLFSLDSYNSLYGAKMPTPSYGAISKVEGNKVIIISPSIDLRTTGWILEVKMASSRSATLSDTITIPEDLLGIVYDMVVAKLVQRIHEPKDLSNDGVDKKTDP